MVNNNSNKVFRMIRNRLIGLAATGVLAITALNSFFVVDQREQAVVTQFGNPKRIILNPQDAQDPSSKAEMISHYEKQGIAVSEGAGARLKIPYLQHVAKFDRRLLRWNGYPEQIPTADKKYIWVDLTTSFVVRDPLKFLNTVGSEEQAHGRLDDIVDSIVRNCVTKRNLIEVVRTDNRDMRFEDSAEDAYIEHVSEGRAQIVEEIRAKSDEACLQKYGIHILPGCVLIKGVGYVDEVKKNVEGRMSSERLRIAQKFTSEGKGEAQKILGEKNRKVKEVLSGAYREAREIEGGADAEAARIYAEAYGKNPDFYKFIRTLGVCESGLTIGNTRFITGTDGPLFYIFGNNSLPKPQKEKTKN